MVNNMFNKFKIFFPEDLIPNKTDDVIKKI